MEPVVLKWRSLHEVLDMCMRRFGYCNLEHIEQLLMDVPTPEGNREEIIAEFKSSSGKVTHAEIHHRYARDKADKEMSRFGMSADSAHDPDTLDDAARAAHHHHLRTRRVLHEEHTRHRKEHGHHKP